MAVAYTTAKTGAERPFSLKSRVILFLSVTKMFTSIIDIGQYFTPDVLPVAAILSSMDRCVEFSGFLPLYVYQIVTVLIIMNCTHISSYTII